MEEEGDKMRCDAMLCYAMLYTSWMFTVCLVRGLPCLGLWRLDGVLILDFLFIWISVSIRN